MPARTYRLHGRVQGVGFRWWARVQAERLGLTGAVRNEPDGSVVAVAAGDEAALASFRTCLGRGPAGARVDRVEESAGPDGDFEGFQITG